MLRTFAIAATSIILAAGAAQAEPLTSRIHTAAVKACAPEASAKSIPLSHYGVIADTCVYRISKTAMNEMQAKAFEKTKAATASN